MKKRGRPSKADILEREEIERKAWISRENFALYSLQGMLNTTRHILSHFVTKRDAQWFEDCIEYMMERIREQKEVREAERHRRKDDI